MICNILYPAFLFFAVHSQKQVPNISGDDNSNNFKWQTCHVSKIHVRSSLAFELCSFYSEVDSNVKESLKNCKPLTMKSN